MSTVAISDPVFDLHRGGKMAITPTVALADRDDLSLAYTPGVARVCEAIAADPSLVDEYTWVSHTVAVVTDGTAVLGLGDIGPRAAMPVMEGKAVLFKQFGDVDAVPICLDTRDIDGIVATVTALAPSFGGINLEDISAPRCFEIERRLDEARRPAQRRDPARPQTRRPAGSRQRCRRGWRGGHQDADRRRGRPGEDGGLRLQGDHPHRPGRPQRRQGGAGRDDRCLRRWHRRRAGRR
jgi:hypothetical protein